MVADQEPELQIVLVQDLDGVSDDYTPVFTTHEVGAEVSGASDEGYFGYGGYNDIDDKNTSVEEEVNII